MGSLLREKWAINKKLTVKTGWQENGGLISQWYRVRKKDLIAQEEEEMMKNNWRHVSRNKANSWTNWSNESISKRKSKKWLRKWISMEGDYLISRQLFYAKMNMDMNMIGEEVWKERGVGREWELGASRVSLNACHPFDLLWGQKDHERIHTVTCLEMIFFSLSLKKQLLKQLFTQVTRSWELGCERSNRNVPLFVLMLQVSVDSL